MPKELEQQLPSAVEHRCRVSCRDHCRFPRMADAGWMPVRGHANTGEQSRSGIAGGVNSLRGGVPTRRASFSAPQSLRNAVGV
jgi:hypothetical protein